MTRQEKLQKAVHHVVHDYANLVSSGMMAVQGHHLEKVFDPPVNTHIAHAFLVNCRKMYDFFNANRKQKDDILAKDFLKQVVVFDLSNWALWNKAMNKQLMHVTFERVENWKEWKGHEEINRFLDEFMKAWKEFLRNLEESFKSRFDSEIDKKLDTEFRGLDLR